MKKKLLNLALLIIVCGIIASLIGFPKINTQSNSKKNSDAYSYTKTLPWDLKLWENAKLKCQNRGTTSSDLFVSLLGKNDSDSLATSFTIPAGKTITKKLSNLALLRKKQKSQNGTILIESDTNDISCSITSLPYKGSEIDSNDIVRGESYIVVAPKVLAKGKGERERLKTKLIIYNLDDTPLNLSVEYYTQTGDFNYYKKLQAIGSGRKKILNIKKISQKNGTFHLIPEADSSRYLAYLELTDEDGKQYSIKSSYEIKDAIINNAKGVLVVSNISSAPTMFTYTLSTKEKKAYQGVEWLMPNSQRIFDLKKYTKKLSSPTLNIKNSNIFHNKDCTYSEEKNDFECSYTTKTALIAINFYPKTSQSPKVITGSYSADISETQRYDQSDYKVPALPIECYKDKDSDKDGLCDFEEEAYGSGLYEKDSDNDGLLDGEEFFHNFSSPNKADTDDDNYDDYTEYEAKTLAFTPLEYPNSPSLYSIEGLILADNYYRSLKQNNESNYSSMNFYNIVDKKKREKDVVLENKDELTNISPIIQDYNCNAYKSFCEGENVCIEVGKGVDEKLSQKSYDQLENSIKSCLNLIRGATANSENSECNNYCYTKLTYREDATECPINTSITINLLPEEGRSGAFFNQRVIDFYIVDKLGPDLDNYGRLEHTVCHELMHTFGLIDYYKDVEEEVICESEYQFDENGDPVQETGIKICSLPIQDNIPCTAMSGFKIDNKYTDFCMSNFDKWNLEIISSMCNTGASLEEIKNENGILDCGTNGKKIKYKGYNGPCIESPYDNYKCVKVDDKKICPEDPSAPCNECPDNKVKNTAPNGSNDYICCGIHEQVYINEDNELSCCEGSTLKDTNNKWICCDYGDSPYLNENNELACCYGDAFKDTNNKWICCDHGRSAYLNENNELACCNGDTYIDNNRYKKCCEEGHSLYEIDGSLQACCNDKEEVFDDKNRKCVPVPKCNNETETMYFDINKHTPLCCNKTTNKFCKKPNTTTPYKQGRCCDINDTCDFFGQCRPPKENPSPHEDIDASPADNPTEEPKQTYDGQNECKPTEEICDGKDNDCDGEIDEDFENKHQICEEEYTNEKNENCKKYGYYICSEDGKSLICNFVSDSCDGPKDPKENPSSTFSIIPFDTPSNCSEHEQYYSNNDSSSLSCCEASMGRHICSYYETNLDGKKITIGNCCEEWEYCNNGNCLPFYSPTSTNGDSYTDEQPHNSGYTDWN